MERCRACGEPPGEHNQLSENLQKYSDIFYNLTSIQLTTEEDPNHQRICASCHCKLLEYNSFRSTCLQVHYKLTEIKKENLPEKNEGVTLVEALKVELLEINAEIDTNDKPIQDKEKAESDHDFYAVELESEPVEDSVSDCEKPKKKTRIPKNKDRIKEKPYGCNLCDKKFRDEIRLQGHLRVHQGLKPALCTYCGKDFSKYNHLKVHITQKHSNAKMRFPCDFSGCEMVYATKQGMINHKKRHDPNFVPPEPKRSVCDQCGKTFSTKGSLKAHSYIHTGIRPFQCTICDKRFPDIHKLNEHIMRHEGIKNHVCSYCGQKKTTLKELKVHMNYHTREKQQFACDICAQTFSNIANRTRHIEVVHYGVKAFSCSFCDLSFSKSYNMKRHVMTHHKEKTHECELCGKSFIELVSLQIHTKTHRECKQQKSTEHQDVNSCISINPIARFS
ncbi:gastrula zinc finger protein XlCGF57.1-like [Toxorhynchites rutilus septentrionalis]|uniref:gastrula zinc finger protein XlCGF57.1-like n=1 Tax=Toxorhynchites rutilus septentrionalis TaxID=329112 RepID=UPI00247869EF|nr:gastrula zinc finger protein XlCGF57.1-like [Toxorhynchites rutilus septentrionalis]